MEREEAIKRTEHYRCRLCGQLSPVTDILCSKPSCRAQLSLYGEIQWPKAEETPVQTPQASQEAAWSSAPAGQPAAKRFCPKCGAEIPAGSAGCAVCGYGFAAPAPEAPPERKAPKVTPAPEPVPPVKAKPAREKSGTGRLVLLLLAVGFGIVTVVMGFLMVQAMEDADYWQYKYYNLEDDFAVLEDDYAVLKDDYADLEAQYNARQEFIEMNGFDELYTVQVTEVYNADGEGNKISAEVNAKTLDRLCIGINITAADIRNRWKDPLVVKLYRGGYEITKWEITPGESSDDSESVAGWKMWTGDVTSSGTYVAEFYHRGILVARYQITVD